MEHRLSKRIPGELKLLIYRRGMPVATGRIKDASKQGLFINTDYNDIQLNQMLEVEFRFPGNPDKQLCRIKAHVVRMADEGLGVDFGETNRDALTISKLVRWLSEQRIASHYFPSLRRA
ncbi:hypothetical protein GCM10011533_27470 [Streptosporangium jomthongense]|uniref:PilZ domain-containing protein n=1 Tax=Marinobacter aromaticivorans TaxID=1494078 RepID=A0ABW2IXI9_9GAMM|nr:PilZ domain-containing protein [Marinobacter aromaticivorans]GGE73564.1 hypothetical protein GCM10011533_27470 [Streptosporangium jomthongense]